LQAIEERANAATPGEWQTDDDTVEMFDADEKCYVMIADLWSTTDVDKIEAARNAEFIANARADVPALIAEVRSLRAKLDAVPVAELRFWWDPFKDALTNDAIERAAATIEAWLKTQEVQP